MAATSHNSVAVETTGRPPQIEVADFSEFMESLPKNSVDLILTDPPYTISKETGFKSVVNGVQRFAVSMDFGAWDHCQIDLAGHGPGVLQGPASGRYGHRVV